LSASSDRGRRPAILPALLPALLIVCLALLPIIAVSLLLGAMHLDLSRLLTDAGALEVLAVSRLPRTLAALLSGAALAIAGVILQQILRNRLVDPGTTGTVEGAALGILLISMTYPQAPVALKMLAATLAALVATAGFLLLARRLPPREVLLVPLTGLVYSAIIGSVVVFIGWESDMLQYIGIWLSGEFSGVLAGRYELLWIAGAAAALAWFAADRLAIAGLGEAAAVSLGVDYRRTVAFGVLAVAVVTAMVVATVGMIPFVGLVVPNIVARRMGDNLRRTMPVIALAGGGLVLLCDVIGRAVRYPYEIPVGTVLGVVGAAIFLWLLYVGPRHG
jgi:iron complex transport system permease protein